ncbi:hypothetical protein JTB14_028995 [Gonioctena quinquepunctata]|nr:hypothetical protein JTB14_028995 [Gonioctena quinquepunctata]
MEKIPDGCSLRYAENFRETNVPGLIQNANSHIHLQTLKSRMAASQHATIVLRNERKYMQSRDLQKGFENKRTPSSLLSLEREKKVEEPMTFLHTTTIYKAKTCIVLSVGEYRFAII